MARPTPWLHSSLTTVQSGRRDLWLPIRRTSTPLSWGGYDLYTIQGRTDAAGCTLAQPNFVFQLSDGNVIFRIPTPLFGLDLVENTPDATLQANLNSTANARRNLGFGGSFNTSGNNGTITRFSWKAQNKSLLIFAPKATTWSRV